MATKSERFELRMNEEQILMMDKWASEQHDRPSRSEAARRLIEVGLLSGSNRLVHFTDGEKMLMMMMGEVFKSLKIKDPEISPQFLSDVIHGGHYWAPKWELSGIFHDHADKPEELDYVVDVLDMWGFMEEGYERLDADEKAALTQEIPWVTSLKFPGFDGNNEGTHLGIASFLTEMGRFKRFKNRILNSHMPTYERYSAMIRIFTPMRKLLVGKTLTLNQLIELLKRN